jgi:formate hydrogenlyase transcriptional activator
MSSPFTDIVGTSPSLQRVFADVLKVAATDTTVLLLGETGTGKELFARAIHGRSRRSSHPFMAVSCAAIPQTLIASELFGHERGAFTGALSRRVGRFEAAAGGSILLDEIGELSLETQVPLLRVLQERQIERVGSNLPTPVDVRVLAATHRDLDDAVEQGLFREDLYYRLNVFPISIPPLRERPADIPVLVAFLLERYATRLRKTVPTVDMETLELLQSYNWPGNVRQLENVIERAVVICENDVLEIEEAWLKSGVGALRSRISPSVPTLVEGERALIEAALAQSGGQISGLRGAAAKLGIPRQTLESKIKALRINKFAFRNLNESDPDKLPRVV